MEAWLCRQTRPPTMPEVRHEGALLSPLLTSLPTDDDMSGIDVAAAARSTYSLRHARPADQSVGHDRVQANAIASHAAVRGGWGSGWGVGGDGECEWSHAPAAHRASRRPSRPRPPRLRTPLWSETPAERRWGGEGQDRLISGKRHPPTTIHPSHRLPKRPQAHRASRRAARALARPPNLSPAPNTSAQHRAALSISPPLHHRRVPPPPSPSDHHPPLPPPPQAPPSTSRRTSRPLVRPPNLSTAPSPTPPDRSHYKRVTSADAPAVAAATMNCGAPMPPKAPATPLTCAAGDTAAR